MSDSLCRVDLIRVANEFQFGGSTLENVRFYVGDQNIIGLNVLRKGNLTVAPDLLQFKFESSKLYTSHLGPCELDCSPKR